MTILGSLKSLGHPPNHLDTDDIGNLICCYDNQVSVFDKDLKPLQNFKIKTAEVGEVVMVKVMNNLVVIGTALANFLLFDADSGEEIGRFRGKGWAVGEDLQFMKPQHRSVRNLGGTVSGEVFSFDIN